MIKAIFAIDAFGNMGFNNKLPWPPCKEDFAWFANNTKDKTVIMGRKTWDSVGMPHPLPGRRNIVVCKNRYYKAAGAEVWNDNWLERLERLGHNDLNDVWVIGGVSLLEQARPLIKQFYVTRFKGAYRADTTLNTRTYFEGLQCRTIVPSKENNQINFEVWIPWLSQATGWGSNG
jgi:dihydrofolate reductase